MDTVITEEEPEECQGEWAVHTIRSLNTRTWGRFFHGSCRKSLAYYLKILSFYVCCTVAVTSLRPPKIYRDTCHSVRKCKERLGVEVNTKKVLTFPDRVVFD